jgi:hypothetical protein
VTKSVGKGHGLLLMSRTVGIKGKIGEEEWGYETTCVKLLGDGMDKAVGS